MKAFLAAIYGGIVPFIAVTAAGLLLLNILRIRRRAEETFPLALALGTPLCAALHSSLLRAGAIRRGHFFALAAALLAAAFAVGYKRTRERSPRPGNGFPGFTGGDLTDSPEGGPPGPRGTPWSRPESINTLPEGGPPGPRGTPWSRPDSASTPPEGGPPGPRGTPWSRPESKSTPPEGGPPGPRGTPWSRLEALLPVLLLAAIIAGFGWGYLLAAAGPDTTPPLLDSALAQASAAIRSPRTASTPSPAGLLFLAPLRLGGPSAAAVFHIGYLLALTLLCASAARRIASLWLDARSADWAYFAAGSLVFVSPALALSACDARVEIIGILASAAGLYFASLAATGRSPAAAFAALLTILLVPAAFAKTAAFPGFLLLPLSSAWLAIPFAATAAAVLIAKYRAILAFVVAFHLVTSWIGVARLLAPPELALMEEITWEDATIADRDSYLVRHLPGYIEARFLDESTHPSARIAVETPLARAWTTRDVVPFDDWAPLLAASSGAVPHADRLETRRFSALTGRYLPVPLSSPAAEIRLFHKSAEIIRQPKWMVRCAEAFDNSLLTLCTSATAEIDFGAPVAVDEIRIHGFRGVTTFWPPGLRRAALRELKRSGITHIFLSDGHTLSGDLLRNGRFWGVHEAGERAGAHLYALD